MVIVTVMVMLKSVMVMSMVMNMHPKCELTDHS